jgi:hypothetical protein
MKKCFAVFLSLIFLNSFVFSQSLEGPEYNGSVETSNGEIISGDIFFDAATGKVVVTDSNGSQYFSSRTATYFEFYDFEKNCIRKFYSLLYNNSPTFFELLKETSDLALLSRENVSSTKAIAYLSKSSTSAGTSETQATPFAEKSNSETLFLVDKKGNIKPYVVINKGEKIGTISNYVSPYLLSTLTRGKYQELRKYARDNRYSLKDKEDLIEVLSFYDELARN